MTKPLSNESKSAAQASFGSPNPEKRTSFWFGDILAVAGFLSIGLGHSMHLENWLLVAGGNCALAISFSEVGHRIRKMSRNWRAQNLGQAYPFAILSVFPILSGGLDTIAGAVVGALTVYIYNLMTLER